MEVSSSTVILGDRSFVANEPAFVAPWLPSRRPSVALLRPRRFAFVAPWLPSRRPSVALLWPGRLASVAPWPPCPDPRLPDREASSHRKPEPPKPVCWAPPGRASPRRRALAAAPPTPRPQRAGVQPERSRSSEGPEWRPRPALAA